MEKFVMVYDKMNSNYSAIENMMGVIYQQIQESPDNQQLQSILQGLGDIAKGIISSQMDFTEEYCDPSLKYSLMNKLSDKQSVLSNALNENKGKTL